VTFFTLTPAFLEGSRDRPCHWRVSCVRSPTLRCGLAESSAAEARPPGELAPGEPGLKGGTSCFSPAAIILHFTILVLHFTWPYLTEYITSQGGTLAGLTEKMELVSAARNLASMQPGRALTTYVVACL